MTHDPDLPIIDRILAGEQSVYADLVNRYKSYAYTIAFKVVQSRVEAEEISQDAFVKAYHHLRSFQRESKFSTWLYRIVFNTAISHRRKNRPDFQSIESTTISQGHEGEDRLERSDKRKFLEAAMNRLNQADRTALTLFYLEEFSLEEIAEITGMQANTAKVRIHRARQRLADELKIILKSEALSL
ncbi:MAG TPA: sigma-70 family RNA polymerase sigma factor [Chryseolinea sp.]|nr:sigma-70 family RNA polymerase sigma factor [Chryseolinea sp.]